MESNRSNTLLNTPKSIIRRKRSSSEGTYRGSPVDLYRFTCSTECGRRKPFCTLCLSLLFIHNLGVPVKHPAGKKSHKNWNIRISDWSSNGSETVWVWLWSYSYNLPGTLWLALHLKTTIKQMLAWNLTWPSICDILIAFDSQLCYSFFSYEDKLRELRLFRETLQQPCST